ncbi:MAG: energy transducer TonB [Chitinophagales bacterium]|jgi:protein TonB|nr:energy transducer TonB [Chitinophagales bacterium]MCU0393180.1 energy transducer TonB [Thermoflexibacter sp.]
MTDYFKKSTWSKGWGLRFNLGLTISLALTLVAFEWKSYGEEPIALFEPLATSEELIIEIPNTTQTPPPPKLIQPVVVEVPDDTEDIEEIEVDLTVDIKPQDAISAPVFVKKPTEEPEEVADDAPFTVVEDSAEPEGGMEAFYKFLGKNLKYPAQARRMGVEGKVFVQFVVERDGSLTDIKAVKGIGAGCDEEAERVVKEAKKWKPGKQRGRPVRQKMVIPITFTLG